MAARHRLWERWTWGRVGTFMRWLLCRVFGHQWDDGDYEYAGDCSYYMGTGCRRCWHYEPAHRKAAI